jgi:phosphatidate phosphatase APP1
MQRSLIGVAVLLGLVPGLGQSQTLRKDEEVIVFPSYAYEGKGGSMQLHVHAWVFEPEPDSLWRRSLVKAVQRFFPAPQNPEEQLILQKRLHGFTPDNERNKTVSLHLGSQTLKAGPTGSDGHVQTEWKLNLSAKERAELESNQLTLTWELGGQQKPIWIPGQGLSVVSDIDDTIKVTQVLDRKAMVANSFLRKFQAVPGMPELYKKLAGKGATFHYVSASPWQLYPDLHEFLQENFPQGTISLRKLRWKDSSGVEFLWKDSIAYKIASIDELMQRFPQRNFLLIGDSGEKDPEVYEEIRRRYPARIKGILIRIPPEQKTISRKDGMEYFKDAIEMEGALKRWGI